MRAAGHFVASRWVHAVSATASATIVSTKVVALTNATKKRSTSARVLDQSDFPLSGNLQNAGSNIPDAWLTSSKMAPNGYADVTARCAMNPSMKSSSCGGSLLWRTLTDEDGNDAAPSQVRWGPRTRAARMNRLWSIIARCSHTATGSSDVVGEAKQGSSAARNGASRVLGDPQPAKTDSPVMTCANVASCMVRVIGRWLLAAVPAAAAVRAAAAEGSQGPSSTHDTQRRSAVTLLAAASGKGRVKEDVAAGDDTSTSMTGYGETMLSLNADRTMKATASALCTVSPWQMSDGISLI